MCETLAELRQAAGALVARFDAALVAPGQLGRVVGDAGAIEKMMATLASLAGQCAAPSTPPHRDLAHATGTSLNDAARALEATKQLGSQPDVATAARAGQLSRPQLALVSDAVAANPGAADRLLDSPERARYKSWPTSRPGPGQPTRTSRPAVRPSTRHAACASSPTGPARGRCKVAGRERRGCKPTTGRTARTHVTVLDLLDRLCGLHHGLKTHQGWRLVDGRGKRAFVAPDDPRHPRHRGTHGRSGSAYSEDSDHARPPEPTTKPWEATTKPAEATTGGPEPTTKPAHPPGPDPPEPAGLTTKPAHPPAPDPLEPAQQPSPDPGRPVTERDMPPFHGHPATQGEESGTFACLILPSPTLVATIDAKASVSLLTRCRAHDYESAPLSAAAVYVRQTCLLSG